MPGYTNAWSEIVPAGTDPANTIDDHLRRLRLDFRERLNEIFEDWTDDPVVLKDVYAGLKVANTIIIPFPDFQVDDNWNLDNEGSGGSNIAAWAPIRLIPGVTITKVEMLMQRGSSNVTWRIRRRHFVDGPVASDIISTVVHSTAGMVISDTGVIAHTVGSNDILYIVVENPGIPGWSILAARVTYDTPRVDA